MSEHTPGPWRTDPECGNESVLGPKGIMVADCAIFHRSRGQEENQANASVIAAVPRLLSALVQIREVCDDNAAAACNHAMALAFVRSVADEALTSAQREGK